MSNNLRTRNGLPFNFVNGIKVRGMDIESLIPGIEGIPEAGSKYQFAGNGSNKVFTLPVTPYNKDAVDVYVKQLYVHPDDYTLVGDTITLTEAPPAVVAGETYNVVVKVSLTTLNGYVNASRVSFEGENLDDILEKSKPIANYAALRAYAGAATQVRITDPGIAGFFYYDASDTTSADNGGTVIVAGTKRWKRNFEGAVNVRWFGADPTATVDSTTAINTAIAYVGTNGGGVVRAPAGKYLIDSTVKLNEDSVWLIGDGYGENAISPSTTFIKNFNGVGILVSDRARGGQQLRWKVKGIKLNGNSKTGDGIYVDDAHYGSLEDIYVHDNITDGNGVHFNYAYSNELRNIQSARNYRNYKFENQSHDIVGFKCYSSSSTAEGFYITTSNALSFYGSTHEGTGTIGVWVNRLTKDVVFDGMYIEVTGTGYTSCIRVSEDNTLSYSCRNTALKNIHIRINGTYVTPILLRSGIYGAVVENVNVEYNTLTINSDSRGVLVGWGAGAIAVDGVRVSNIHADLISCTGTGIQVVSSAPNVVDGGVEVVGCTCSGDTLRIGVGGKHHCRNSGAVDGNHLAPVDFAALKSRTSPPTYVQAGSLVYPDGSVWNPTSTGEGLHIYKVGGVYKRIVEHSTSTTAARPAAGLYVGMSHFDTTLGKPIWWNGSAWKDATGATV